MSLLEVDGITHRYATTAGRPVLNDVSLSVDTKQIVAVVGESGCGKTTLGKLIVGLMRPSFGQIRFDGDNIWELKKDGFRRWRRAVQMVHQDPYSSLNPGLTIGNMLGSALLHHKLVSRRDLDEELLRILRQVGLDATPAFLRRYPHQLSGGQRQRAAIARAISLQPRLIVADEVTSMLDVSMRVAILDLLLQFQAERDLTYVFISHDFGVVRYFAQGGGRIVVMFFGVVVEEGTSEDVINHPQHPYTYLLLQSIPVPDPTLSDREVGEFDENVEGEPASQGCIYSNRCPFAEAKCHESRPPLVEVGPGHRAACFFPERVPSVSHLLRESNNHDERSSTLAGQNGTRPADHVAPDSPSEHV